MSEPVKTTVHVPCEETDGTTGNYAITVEGPAADTVAMLVQLIVNTIILK